MKAVVVGASLGGLCAARVLADHFDSVTLVERDELPRGSADRPGVPQGHHVHALLARGMTELEALFPGFRRRARERGALELDMGTTAAFFRSHGWARRQRFGIDLLLASRRLIESVVREKCLALPGVHLVEQTAATGLRTTRDGQRLRVTGIRAENRKTRDPVEIDADLVVDASGRGSKAPEWVRALGLSPPADTVVDGRAVYCTRWYRAPDRVPESWWWRSIAIEPRPPDDLYAAVLIPVEDRQWIVTAAGISGRDLPSDPEGFTAALRWVRSPLIADAVALAEPISPVYRNRSMSSRLRHYESWRQRLDGFVAVAEAACAFNPIYGQGMTTSAICARVLEEEIARSGPTHPDLAVRFFRSQARAQSDPWALATGADLRFPGTVGKRPFGAALIGGYMSELFPATSDDSLVHFRLFEVLQMLRPLSAVFAPSIVARVARSAIRRRLRGHEATARLAPSPPVEEPVEVALSV